MLEVIDLIFILLNILHLHRLYIKFTFWLQYSEFLTGGGLCIAWQYLQNACFITKNVET